MTAANANWRRAMSECLESLARDQIGSPCPIVDHEIASRMTGELEDISVWLICRSRQEKRQFTDTELPRNVASLRRKMIAAGFPESAVASISVKVVSRDELSQGGG